MMRIALLIFGLHLIACHADTEPDARTVFRYNQHNSVTSLDPAFAKTQNNIWAVDALFDGLVQLDDSLHLQPALAHAWTISPDGLTYRFQLRTDAFFHDNPCFPGGQGRRMTAADVVYSFNRLLDDQWPKPGSWIFKDRVDTLQPFMAENDSVFVLRLLKPFPPMLQILTMPYAFVVPQEALDYYGRDFRRHPVGTGPFYLKIWAENHAMVLLKNQRYFEFNQAGQRLPYLDAIRISFMGDRKTAYLAFRKGELDYLFGLESSYISELLTAEGDLKPALAEEMYFLKNPYLNTEYMGIRMGPAGDSALQNPKIRQALNCGFDRRQLLRTLRHNVGRAADSGFAPAGLPGYDPLAAPGYVYDPSRAAQLLKEAGFPNGNGLPELSLLCNADYMDIAVFITRQWEQLGVHCRIELQETALLRERMRNGQAPFFRASWIADYPDAESYYTCFYSKNGAPPNYTGFEHAGFDALYEKALSMPNLVDRIPLYQAMDRILIEQAPVIFLFYDETAQFAHHNVQDLPRNGMALLRLKGVRKR